MICDFPSEADIQGVNWSQMRQIISRLHLPSTEYGQLCFSQNLVFVFILFQFIVISVSYFAIVDCCFYLNISSIRTSILTISAITCYSCGNYSNNMKNDECKTSAEGMLGKLHE